MPRDELSRYERRRRQMFVVAREIGLTDGERIEFAEMLLRRDVNSWSELTVAEQQRIADGLEGHLLLSRLLALRPPEGPVE